MIHPTAVVAAGARLGADVTVGPFSAIGEHVAVGDGCVIGPRVTLTGHTVIGARTRIHTGAVVGDEPQDTHYGGETSYTEIGDDCVLREYVTVHRGTAAESETIIGNHVMLMVFAHVGHNCVLGDHVILANGATLGGYVQVGPRAFLSAQVLVHQFVRIGTLAMVGGGTIVTQDVPPYCMLPRTLINGPNTVGLRRAGIPADTRQALRQAIKLFFFAGLNRPNALAAIREQVPDSPELQCFTEFIATTKRGITGGTLQDETTEA